MRKWCKRNYIIKLGFWVFLLSLLLATISSTVIAQQKTTNISILLARTIWAKQMVWLMEGMTPPGDARDIMRQLLKNDNTIWTSLENYEDVAGVYEKAFSPLELRTLLKFFESDIGQDFLLKQPDVNRAIVEKKKDLTGGLLEVFSQAEFLVLSDFFDSDIGKKWISKRQEISQETMLLVTSEESFLRKVEEIGCVIGILTPIVASYKQKAMITESGVLADFIKKMSSLVTSLRSTCECVIGKALEKWGAEWFNISEQVRNKFMIEQIESGGCPKLSLANMNTFIADECIEGDCENGKGTMLLANGDKYVGEFKHSKRNGQGAYTRTNGAKYAGEWKDDKPHGQGTKTWANGDKYVGKWKDGKMHGQGIFTWAKGDKYVGEWKYGKPHGQGARTLANGDKYVGEWKDNTYHGQGTLTAPDGRKIIGEWKDGKPVKGQCKRVHPDGTVVDY